MPSQPPAPDKPTSLWKQTTVLRNARGKEEAISIGPDGHVWSYIADPGQQRATDPEQRMENLGMEADFVTAGRRADGALVVIAAKGLSLQYRTETASGIMSAALGSSSRWTPVQAIPLPAIRGAVGVRRLYTQSDVKGMRVALIVDTHTQEHGSSYVMACSQWGHTGPGPFILLPPLNPPSTELPKSSRTPLEPGMFRFAHSS